MTRRQLFKNVGFGLAGLLALPLVGKPGKAPEPPLKWTQWCYGGVPGLSEQNYEIRHYRKGFEIPDCHEFATELRPLYTGPYPAQTEEATQRGIDILNGCL